MIRIVVFPSALLLSHAAAAQASIHFKVNSVTANSLSVTFSGTFDQSVAAYGYFSYVAIKNDWSNNQGVNVDWINDGVSTRTLGSDNLITVVENSVLIGTQSMAGKSYVSGSGLGYGDFIYFKPTGSIAAGTAISGNLQIQKNFGGAPPLSGDLFSTLPEDLQLVSGFRNNPSRWARLEANADYGDTNPVPEPATIAIWSVLGLAGFGLGVRRRFKRADRS